MSTAEASTSSNASTDDPVADGSKKRKSVRLQRTESRASSAPTVGRKGKGRNMSLKDVLTLRNGSVFNAQNGVHSRGSEKRSKEIQPGLRAMLYGLTLKMEREEANFKKQQHKKQSPMTMTTARSSCPASPTTASHSKREWTTSRLFSKKSSSTKSNRTKTAIKFMGSSATGMTASSPLTK
uniref:Tyrosine-protein phosphatase domain-containing protein n=1 Tax=Ditylenchus dipsaci TaxID=166011 RepID=A0A915DHN3_9BILA